MSQQPQQVRNWGSLTVERGGRRLGPLPAPVWVRPLSLPWPQPNRVAWVARRLVPLPSRVTKSVETIATLANIRKFACWKPSLFNEPAVASAFAASRLRRQQDARALTGVNIRWREQSNQTLAAARLKIWKRECAATARQGRELQGGSANVRLDCCRCLTGNTLATHHQAPAKAQRRPPTRPPRLT